MHFQYQFFPVGQGLFSFGKLATNSGKGPMINWVYDCGSTSAGALLTNQINLLARSEGKDPRLNLLFISHFDKDHISGVTELLQRFKVDAILLPYLSAEQLLVHAIHAGVEPDDPEFEFFVRPSDYLANAAAERGVNKIIYVPPSDGIGPEIPPYEDGLNDDQPGEVNIPTTDVPPGADHLNVTPGWNKPTVRQLAGDGAIRIGPVWEFVMYNDAPPAKLWELDVPAIKTFRDILKSSIIEDERRAALEEIKRLFEEKLKGGLNKNLISLFVYAGPVSPRPLHGMVEVVIHALGGGTNIYSSDHYVSGRPFSLPSLRGAILYTGDGYLDTSARLIRFTRFLRNTRIARINVLQVMHHGAEDNWHLGVAAALHPSFSIFSSDPAHRGFKHPHTPVVDDFQPYNVIKVDRANGCSIQYYRH